VKKFSKEHHLPDPVISFDSNADPNVVTEQDPKPGEKIDPNQPIHVKVGANGVPVKNYIGSWESHARDDRDNPDQVGYQVQIYWCAESGGQAPNHIFKQVPAPGQLVTRGGVVKVYTYTPGVPTGCELAKK
jgi:beta-lactam-binding protein with PASTA domain